MEEKTQSFIRGELKWISIVIAFTASVLFNYFTVIKCVQLNTYRINEIVKDRTVRWEKYDNLSMVETGTLQEVGKDIAIIKTKLEQIEGKLK